MKSSKPIVIGLSALALAGVGVGVAFALGRKDEGDGGTLDTGAGGIKEAELSPLQRFAETHSLGFENPKLVNNVWRAELVQRPGEFTPLSADALIPAGTGYISCPTFKSLMSKGEARLLSRISNAYGLTEVCREPPRKWSKRAEQVVGAVVDHPLNREVLGRNSKDVRFRWKVVVGFDPDGWVADNLTISSEWEAWPTNEAERLTNIGRKTGLPQNYPVIYLPEV